MKPLPKTLLIIDDDEDWIAMLGRFLSSQGYTVHSASSSAEGLDIARRCRPDCVLVDFKLGGEDGMNVCRDVKADEALGGVPVIVMSGCDSDDVTGPCDAFICKVDGLDRILSIIRNVLSK